MTQEKVLDQFFRDYYRKSVEEYEKVYYADEPAIQKELRTIESAVARFFSGLNVLEIACGTGFWTEKVASAAKSVTAIDLIGECIDFARKKKFSKNNVQFLVADAFELAKVPGEFNAGFSAFWFGHVPKAKLPAFLNDFHKKLKPGSPVMLVDNVLGADVGGDLLVELGQEDTHKLRRLSDGSLVKLVKNYYNDMELTEILGDRVSNLDINRGRQYWWLTYQTR